MPELPEVETIVRELKPVLLGKTIESISTPWPRTVGGDEKSFSQALVNRKISRVERRGKYICIFFNNEKTLTIHLRMTGKCLFTTTEKEKKHIRVIFTFDESTKLYFVDVRKFGRMQLWSPDEELLPKLGPEPLDPKTVYNVLTGLTSTRAIKTVLLDQTVLAGVGNIYADEALFRARIHPQCRADKVAKRKLKSLSRLIPEILIASILNKGTTISDYRTTQRSKGSNQFFLKVYGRNGEPCKKCSQTIRRISINGRSSHFCPRCQPARNIKK